MNELAEKLLQHIDAQRLRDRLFAMVSIPSPTQNAQAMAEHYAALLHQLGLQADLRPLAGYPNSPSVIAWQKGKGSAPSLQFAGHMDTIHAPHAPPRIEGNLIYGRGADDMKSGLTAIAETLQILLESDIDLPGDILVTAYDMHEHPVGHGEGVFDLIDAGIIGDAAIVAEGPAHELAIAGKGTTIFEIEIRSPAGSPHELTVTSDLTNPFHVAIELGKRLIAFGEYLKTQPIELLGTETIFLSRLHCGDFFNRLPGSALIVGTRRFAPGRGFQAIQAELQAIVDETLAGTELSGQVTLQPMREGFRQSPESRLVQAARQAYRELYHQELPFVGQLFGADNEFFVNRAKIASVCMGVGLGRAHADVEYVTVESLVELSRRMLLTALCYFGLA